MSSTTRTGPTSVALNFGETPARATYHGLPRPGRCTAWFARTPTTLGTEGHLETPAHDYRVLVQ